MIRLIIIILALLAFMIFGEAQAYDLCKRAPASVSDIAYMPLSRFSVGELFENANHKSSMISRSTMKYYEHLIHRLDRMSAADSAAFLKKISKEPQKIAGMIAFVLWYPFDEINVCTEMPTRDQILGVKESPLQLSRIRKVSKFLKGMSAKQQDKIIDLATDYVEAIFCAYNIPAPLFLVKNLFGSNI